MIKPNGGFQTRYYADMRRMSGLLSDIYTPLETQQWLLTENKMLGDQTPSQLIARGHTDEVETVIMALLDGAFM